MYWSPPSPSHAWPVPLPDEHLSTCQSLPGPRGVPGQSHSLMNTCPRVNHYLVQKECLASPLPDDHLSTCQSLPDARRALLRIWFTHRWPVGWSHTSVRSCLVPYRYSRSAKTSICWPVGWSHTSVRSCLVPYRYSRSAKTSICWPVVGHTQVSVSVWYRHVTVCRNF